MKIEVSSRREVLIRMMEYYEFCVEHNYVKSTSWIRQKRSGNPVLGCGVEFQTFTREPEGALLALCIQERGETRGLR